MWKNTMKKKTYYKMSGEPCSFSLICLSAPLRSAPGILDKYPHMLMVLGLMENRFDGT